MSNNKNGKEIHGFLWTAMTHKREKNERWTGTGRLKSAFISTSFICSLLFQAECLSFVPERLCTSCPVGSLSLSLSLKVRLLLRRSKVSLNFTAKRSPVPQSGVELRAGSRRAVRRSAIKGLHGSHVDKACLQTAAERLQCKRSLIQVSNRAQKKVWGFKLHTSVCMCGRCGLLQWTEFYGSYEGKYKVR